MSETLTIEETKYVAELTNLTLTEKELNELRVMLSDTLDYINMLDELDTALVKETFQVTGLKNVFQTVSVGSETLSQNEALANADEKSEGKFVTEAVFDR